ncbi:hypothetical protein [Streptomyces sp. NPDC005953]|uniref:hypothetical protein n=1 Tax=unclassified Streptomyces TaxID=2593676 RepID=UPI0033F980E7
MRDRRRRTDLLLSRERQSTDDNNPFAPPPEGKPDQPWQPRQPSNDQSSGSGSTGSSGSESPDNGAPDSSGSSGSSDERGRWGSQWSSRQPGRSSGGGFGGRPGGSDGSNGGQQGPGGTPPGLRWDPTDPAQRRARYSLLSGMWAFFFVLFDFTEIALLLGALSLYWGISSLKANKKRDTSAVPGAAANGASAQAAGRSQRTAAVTGVVMAGIALLIVAGVFASQLVFRDFYTCERDALTKNAQIACNQELPKDLRGVLGVQE